MRGSSTKNTRDLPKFSSELLLQQAVAGLLTRIPQVSSVQILHGAQEYGKDIVFDVPGPLADSIICACVIKNGRISGKVGDNRGVRSVFEQAEQALDTPYLDGSGQEIRVQRAYIVSPDKIPQTTISSIKGKLSTRAGQVVFIDGAKLYQLFRKYWLDFLADEHGALEAHLERIEKMAARAEVMEVSTVYGLGEVSHKDAAIYVSRVLSKKMRRYSYRSPSETPVPTGEQLREQVGKLEIEGVRARLRTLIDLVSTLSTWGFARPVGAYESLDELNDAIAKLTAEFTASWLATAGKDLGQYRPTLRTVPKAETKKVGGKTKILYTYVPENLDELEELSLRVSSGVNECLLALRVACRLSQKQAPADLFSVADLDSVKGRLVSTLDDCFQHSSLEPLCSMESEFSMTPLPESELRRMDRSMLIVGAAGYGKTYFCRWNALLDAEALRSGEGKSFPVYIPLHALGRSKIGSFEDTFLENLGRSALIDDKMAPVKSVRLYLDGLDEVPTEKQRRRIVNTVRDGLEANPNVQLIMTARDYIAGQWLSWLPRVDLSDLTPRQVAELEEKWLAGNEVMVKRFRKQIGDLATLRDLMRVPLLATLILLVFRQTRRLPESRARLYSVFVDLLSGGWDLAKGVLRPSRFGRAVKVMILTSLAESVHETNKRFFGKRDIDRAIQKVFVRGGSEAHDVLRRELLVDGLIGRSGEEYFFSHHSFQEFLTARSMLGEPKATRFGMALRRYFAGHDWWGEVVRFYLGLVEAPIDVARWLFTASSGKNVSRPDADRVMGWLQESFPDIDPMGWLKEIK